MAGLGWTTRSARTELLLRAVGGGFVRKRSAAALGCAKHAADARREVRERLVVNLQVQEIFVWRCLTPELSRAAKRRRLERIVSWVSGYGTVHAALPQFT